MADHGSNSRRPAILDTPKGDLNGYNIYMEPNELRVKFKPRKIDLEPRDLGALSNLADGEIVEDPLGRHKPGTTFVINHGDIGSLKFPKIMFPAVNPIEFYLFSALKNLDAIRELEKEVASNPKKINHLLLEEFQFCIFAVTAVESFVNQMLPGDFVYKDKKGTSTKAELEKAWSIEDKLKKAIPQAVNVSIAGDSTLWSSLTTLISLRNDLVHLKTTYPIVSDFRSYQDVYRRLLDNDYDKSYKAVQEVIKRIGTGGDKFYSEQKVAGDSKGLHSSWTDVLKRGLRSITG